MIDHSYADPLDRPGEADLTAHVDFDALARAAGALEAFPVMDQGDFLAALGIAERARALASAHPERADGHRRRSRPPHRSGRHGHAVQGAVPRLARPQALSFRIGSLDMPMVPPIEQDPALAALPGIVHGFFGRRANSLPSADEFDMSETLGTPIANVKANRQRARVYLGLGNAGLAVLTQVHSNRVVVANAPFAANGRPEEGRLVTASHISCEPRPEADALVTEKIGLALGILTADCAPVLMADAKAGVIAACHAGRRGAATGIVANTVAAMEKLGAKRIAHPRRHRTDHFGRPITNCRARPSTRWRRSIPTSRSSPSSPRSRTGLHFDLPGFVIAELVKLGIPAPPLPPAPMPIRSAISPIAATPRWAAAPGGRSRSLRWFPNSRASERIINHLGASRG